MADSTPANPADSRGTRPVPDPTVLTTDQLRREISGLKELVGTEHTALVGLIEEKFRGVTSRFDLVERQRVEQKIDTKGAVDAALIAQKEAVREQTLASATAIAKSEKGTSEQLAQLGANFNTAIAGVTTTLNDLKDRIVKMESVKLGSIEQRQETRTGNAAVYAAVAFAVSILIAAVTVIGLVVGTR